MTQNELLFAFHGAATTSVVSASAVTITAGYPPIVVPAGYFANTGSRSSSLRLKLGGIMTCTATIPTFVFSVFNVVATTSAPAFATTNTLCATAAVTPTGTTANVGWDMEVEIGLRTLALGAGSTIGAMGMVRCPVNFASPFMTTIPASGAYTPLATWDTTQAYVLWPGLTLGAATAGNTVTVEYLKLYGEN